MALAILGVTMVIIDVIGAIAIISFLVYRWETLRCADEWIKKQTIKKGDW